MTCQFKNKEAGSLEPPSKVEEVRGSARTHYLPGYSSNFAGSFAGAFWLFLYGFIAAFAIAWIYDRAVAARYPKL